jgi:hypothetical protein
MPETIITECIEIRERIKEWLTREGYEIGTYGLCGHLHGLPDIGVPVKPDWSPGCGAYTVLVTPMYVQTYACQQPYNYAKWYPTSDATVSYKSKEELKSILESMLHCPHGCW